MIEKRTLPVWVGLSLIALTGVKLWLTASQTVFAIGPSVYDDIHFVTQGAYILAGHWLGPYDQYTLIKGPFFPIWIAFVFLLGVPLLLAAQLLYALACGTFTAAVRPLLKRQVYTPILYGALLFNPESNAASVTRVLREQISPALTLLVAGCSLGLFLTAGRKDQRAWWWAAGLGVSFGALWLTREEEVILLPFLALVLGSSVFLAWRSQGWPGIWPQVRFWLPAIGIWAVMVLTVDLLNYTHYGLFDKTELDAYSFRAAYGALARVKPEEYKPLVPVTDETRLRIYPVSPAFKQLKPYLEGVTGVLFTNVGAYMADESNQGEILGAWWPWALRAAVSAAGYYQGGRYPDAYYLRIAREVNAACDQGKLACYGPRATVSPVWHFLYIQPWIQSFASKSTEMLTFRVVDLHATPSVGLPQELALFRDITQEPLTPPQQYSIEIEAIATDAAVTFRIDDGQGGNVAYRFSQSPSPDFQAYLTSQGDLFPASQSRYDLVAPCTTQCRLDILTNGSVEASIPFDQLQPDLGIVRQNDVLYHIVSTDVPPAKDPQPYESALGAIRVGFLRAIWTTYQLLIPFLAVVAILAYIGITIAFLRAHVEGERWIALTGLGLLWSARLALISLIDVTSFRIPPGSYILEAYPIMLAFLGIACLAAVDCLILIRNGPSVLQSARPTDGKASPR